MSNIDDIRSRANEYLEKMIDPEVGSYQSIANYLSKEENLGILEKIMELLEEYNNSLVESYSGLEFECSPKQLERVLNANSILICPGVTRMLVDDKGRAYAKCALTYISLDAAEIGDVSYSIVGEIEYRVDGKIIDLPPRFKPDEIDEEYTDHGDYGDENDGVEAWDVEDAIYNQFLMAARTLTLVGYEVRYLTCERKSITINQTTQQIQFPCLETFDPSADLPENLCVVNLHEYSQKPEIVLKKSKEDENDPQDEAPFS